MLFSRVSPNKTWEGAASGLVAALGTALLARYVALPFLSVGESLVVGVVVGIFGQLGDLAESLLKRDAGVKDSSNIIPGHGGMLDRFDSLLFVSPILFLFFDFVLF
jgi:phosphatidate cytidylyltransferase